MSAIPYPDSSGDEQEEDDYGSDFEAADAIAAQGQESLNDEHAQQHQVDEEDHTDNGYDGSTHTNAVMNGSRTEEDTRYSGNQNGHSPPVQGNQKTRVNESISRYGTLTMQTRELKPTGGGTTGPPRELRSGNSERKEHDLSLSRRDRGDDGSYKAPSSQRSGRSSRRSSGNEGLATFAAEQPSRERNGRPHIDRSSESSEETLQKLRLANQALRRQVQQLNNQLEEAKAFGAQRRDSVGSRQGSEGANAERKRLLAELSNKDKQLRNLTKKLEGMKKSLQSKKEQVERAFATDQIMNMENEKRDLQRQLAAMADENKALRNMQRQLVRKIDEQDQANSEFPQRLAAMSEDVRSLKERLRSAQANEAKAKQDYDKQRERLMNCIDQNRELKAKLRKQQPGKKGATGSKNSTPASSAQSSPANSPSGKKKKDDSNYVHINVFRAAEQEWAEERQQLLEHVQRLEKQLAEANATNTNQQNPQQESVAQQIQERETRRRQIQQSQVASHTVEPPEEKHDVEDSKQSSLGKEMPSWYKKASLNQVKANQGSRLHHPEESHESSHEEEGGKVSNVQFHGKQSNGNNERSTNRGLANVDYSNLADSGNEDDYDEDFDGSDGDTELLANLTENNKPSNNSKQNGDANAEDDLPPWLRDDTDDEGGPTSQDPFAKPAFSVGAKKTEKDEYDALFR